jgi:hypothetical protein
MRPYSRWIFLAIIVIQVAWYCNDARDWCLWLPGLTICAAGLLVDRRSYLCGSTLFWIVCLVLYVIAPASQLEDNYFRGPISVIGIHFSDSVIMRTVALTDVFMGAALIVQLILRRSTAHQETGRRYVDRSAASWTAIPSLGAPATAASAGASGQDVAAYESGKSVEDNQVFVLVDDPGEFRSLLKVEDAVPEAASPSAGTSAEYQETDMRYVDRGAASVHANPLQATAGSAGSDGASGHDDAAYESGNSAEDSQVYVLVDDPGEFRSMLKVGDAVPETAPPASRTEEGTAAAAASASDPVSAILQSRVLATVMLLISIGVPVGIFLMVGNLDFVTSGRSYALTAFSDNSALWTFMNSFTQDLLVVLCLIGIERFLARRSTSNAILLAVVAGFMLSIINPFNTARYQVGAVMIMALLFFCRGRFPAAFSYVGMALYMYAIMPMMNLLREGVAGMQGQKVVIGVDYNTLDYDCFSMFAFAVYRTGIDGFTYGKFICSSVLFFLPRSWWPDKPMPSSSDLGQYLMRHHSGWFDNLSCPPMGDGYMDFGIAGVLCMGALFAYLLERSDQVIDNWSQMTIVRRGMAAAFVAFIPILLRGSLGAVMGFVIAPLVVLFIIWVLARSYRWMTGNSTRPRLAWEMRSLVRE